MDLLFIKVLNMSISASWLVLVVLVMRMLLKKSPKWISVALWALVALRLVCPYSLESTLSLTPEGTTDRIVESISGDYYGDAMIYSMGSEEYDAAVQAGVKPEVGDNGYQYVITRMDDPTKPVQTVAVLYGQIWLLGIAGMVLHAWISYFRLKRKVSASLDLGKGVFLCDYIDTPFILGIAKPKIYLPSTMDQNSVSYVLAHERSHIARCDHWWKPLGYLLLSIHWFNPLLWLAYILLCRDIELACDEKVIRDMESHQKKAYSEALLNCSVNRRMIAACPLAFGEVGVKERVKTVLNYKKPAFWIVLAAILALTVTAVCFLTDPVKKDKAPTQDGALRDPSELAWLYWTQYMEQEYSATLRFISFGRDRRVPVSYDGENYTISDEAGQRQYRYCVKSQATSEIDVVEEYFFLTNDPNMTADQYLTEKDILATEVLYVDRKTFSAAQSYGEVPESVENIMELVKSSPVWWYCQDSMFGIRAIMAMSSVREACIVERFDYAGNLLCEFESRGVPQMILELNDGGFVVFGTSEPDGLYAFNCYNETGKLRWKYTPEEGGGKCVLHMYQKNGDIYGFGELDPEGEPDDIYIWRISREGELIQELKIGGSDFDRIRRVLETETGFEIFGRTQSGDGDLPFSQDGHGVDFRLEISPELQVLSKEQFENNYASQIGYHHGQPVFEDDEIVKTSRKDKLPEVDHTFILGTFDWEDGYVVVRKLYYDAYHYDHPLLSRQSYYDQLVITGYDVGGNPQWQLAGNVRPG